MTQYKSTYDRIMAEMKADGKHHVLSEATNIKIMQELNADDEGFAAEQKMKEVHSELELAYVVLNF